MDLKTLTSLVKVLVGAGGIGGFRNIIETAEQEVMQMGDLAAAGQHAVTRLDTAPPGGGVNIMVRDMPLAKKFKLLPTMGRIVSTVALCGKYMMEKLSSTRRDAGPETWQAIRDLAAQHGAVELGFTRISEHDIFKGFAVPYRNAIVFSVDMQKQAIDTAPSYDVLMEILSTYYALGQLALKLSDYLRERGFAAYRGFPIGGLVDYVRVAEQAGIGAIGYHGMLISPQEGTRQRINVVFTNMELPEPAPQIHDWVLDFCEMCQKCVRECPPEAIFTSAAVDAETGRKRTLHYDRCVTYYGENQGCAICVKVCPFSQAGYEKIWQGFAEKKVAS